MMTHSAKETRQQKEQGERRGGQNLKKGVSNRVFIK